MLISDSQFFAAQTFLIEETVPSALFSFPCEIKLFSLGISHLLKDMHIHGPSLGAAEVTMQVKKFQLASEIQLFK